MADMLLRCTVKITDKVTLRNNAIIMRVIKIEEIEK